MRGKLTNIWKSLRQSVAFWIVITKIIIAAVFWRAGFHITYSPDIDYNWEAIGAVGEWAALLVGVMIPIGVVYFEHRLQSDKHDISNSNIQLLSELSEVRKYKIESEAKIEMLIQMLTQFGVKFQESYVPNEKTEKEKYDDMKEEALKFVNIAMMASTPQVAEYLGIDVKHAWQILRELCMHDRKIESAGSMREDDYEMTTWVKKKK